MPSAVWRHIFFFPSQHWQNGQEAEKFKKAAVHDASTNLLRHTARNILEANGQPGDDKTVDDFVGRAVNLTQVGPHYENPVVTSELPNDGPGVIIEVALGKDCLHHMMMLAARCR